MNEYLIHHGVKGQKWGVRRYQNEDGTLTEQGKARYGKYTSENYSGKQAVRDGEIYSKSGVRRISKNVNKNGMSVSKARSKEADRINKFSKVAKTSAKVSGVATGIAASFVGYSAAQKLTKQVLDRTGIGSQSLEGMIASSAISSLASVGAGTVARFVSYNVVGGGIMAAGGYNPNKGNWRRE